MRYFVDKILGRPYFALRLATQGGMFGLDQAYRSYLNGSLTLKARPHRLTQAILNSTSPPLDTSQIDPSDHSQAKQSASPQPSSPVSSKISYDVFICYSQADQDWIQARLLPDLKNEGLRVFDRYWDLEPGAPISEEFDRAILNSSKTLLVLTPAALKDDWIERAAQQVIYLDPAHRERRLLLLELEPCPLPRSVNFLVHVDFTDERYREAQFKRLVRAINYTPYTWVPRLVDRLVIQYPMITSTLVMVNTILGLVAILTLTLVIFLIQPSPTPTDVPIPPMDKEDFNIAVAEFALVGEAATEPNFARAGRDVGNWLTDGIRDEKVLYPDIHATVREPDKVGVIPGEDHETRAVKAAQYADQNNVNILIYGVITGSQNSYFVEPEFYVAWHGFDYGSEVAGPDQLGQQVPIYPPFDALEKNDLNIELMSRRRVLHHVVYGLGFLYYNNNDNKYYLKAFDEFKNATNEEQGRDLEVIHLLKGAAKMAEYNNAPCEQREALTQAEDAFTQAYHLNKSYARSYLGLGSVALEQAKIFNADCTGIVGIKRDKLLEARNWYSNSLNIRVDDLPALANVPVKAIFGLGQVNSLGFQQDPTGNWSKDEAQRFFQQVAADYQPGQRPDLIWLAGQAHANLCLLADLDKDWLTVFCECQQAIKILSTLPDERFADREIATYEREIVFAQKQLQREADSNSDQSNQPGDISCENVGK